MLKFTPVLSLVWQIGALEAVSSNYEFIEPEHFFIGLCKLEGFANVTRLRALGVPESQVDSVEAEIDLLMGLFDRFGVNTTTIRHELRQIKGSGGYVSSETDQEQVMHRSTASRQAFDYATQLARNSNATLVAIFHLLAGLLEPSLSNLPAWLNSKGINVLALKQAAEATMMSYDPAHTSLPETVSISNLQESNNALIQYGHDLTRRAGKNRTRLPSIADSEKEKILRILGQSAKNNPLILTEQEGVAQQFVADLAWLFQNDPDLLDWREYRVVQANLTKLAAGISYQGEFADRVQTLIEAATIEPDVILFIDGIEAILGSGTIHVEMDTVIDALIGALKRGELQCIGATTPIEYYRYIGPNAAVNACFKPVTIASPSPRATPDDDSPVEAKPLDIVFSAEPQARPSESLNWFDEIASQKQSAVEDLLGDLESRLKRFGLHLELSQSAKDILARKAADPTGALLRKIIVAQIENPLGGMLLRGEVDYGQSVRVEGERGKLVLRVVTDN